DLLLNPPFLSRPETAVHYFSELCDVGQALRRNDELLDVNPNRPVRASLLVMSVAAVLTRFASDRRKGIRPVGLNAGITEAFPFTRLVWQKSQLRHMTPGIDPTCSYRRNSPPPP